MDVLLPLKCWWVAVFFSVNLVKFFLSSSHSSLRLAWWQRGSALPDNDLLLEGFKEEVKLMRFARTFRFPIFLLLVFSEITHPNVCLFLGACFHEEVMLVTELLEGDLIHVRRRCQCCIKFSNTRCLVAEWSRKELYIVRKSKMCQRHRTRVSLKKKMVDWVWIGFH